MVEQLATRPQLARRPAPPYQPVQIHPKVFTAGQCDRIVQLGLSLPCDAAGLEGDGGESTNDSTLRDSRTSWIPPDPENEWIFRKLATVAERANRQYRFDLTGFDEDLQFTVYDRPGAFYTWHQDGLDGTVANRKLSLVVQLSDPGDYTGGQLELFATRGEPGPAELAAAETVEVDLGDPSGYGSSGMDGADPAHARGSVLVFPSFEFHRVTPLRSGVRHSLVCWVSGPPFR